MTQETNMLLRNTLDEERNPPVPTGVVPRVTPLAPDERRLVPMSQPEMGPAVSEQPAPTPNAHPAVWPLVMVDMASRDHLGRKRYGTPLQPHNGRDTLRDAYEEALDLAVYLRTAIYERDGK